MGLGNSTLNFIRDTVDISEAEGRLPAHSAEEFDDLVRRVRVARELREQDEIEERNRLLDDDAKVIMYDQFYNQTIGTVFIWCFDTVGMSLLVYAVYELASVLNTRSDIWPIMFRWSAQSMVGVSLITGAICALEAFRGKDPALFSRVYMQTTKASCGMISCISSVFTATAWYALNSSEAWTVIFFPTTRSQNRALSIAMVVAQNGLWLTSLVLTYAATPFGASNSAFLEMPVVAFLAFFYILVTEVGNNYILVCGGSDRFIVTMICSNLALLTSFALHAAASFECCLDPPGDHSLRDRWVDCRSTPSQRQIFDPWTFLHGSVLITVLAVYTDRGTPSDELLAAGWILVTFAIIVTILKSFDVQWALRNVFDTSDEMENDVVTLERQFRMKRGDAVALAHQIRDDAAHIPVGKVVDLEGDEDGQSSEEQSEHSSGESADSETLEMLRQKSREYSRRSLRRRARTAAGMFPNIPVSLRREL